MGCNKVKEILDYCRPHVSQMWAAKIVSVILECDFKDAETELDKFYTTLTYTETLKGF